MDSGTDWRVIDADEEEQAPAKSKKGVVASEEHVPRWLIAAIVAVVGAACAFAIWATLPSGGVAIEPTSGNLAAHNVAGDLATPSGSFAAGAAVAERLIVDIEGAVVDPGIHELTAGSRIGDAIDAAGGYAANADIQAVGRDLNLASKLADGQQIHVPALGETVVPASLSAGDGGNGNTAAPGGLIDINHATAEQLDTLPGIGPVTAAKIIDARSQAPFSSIDELQSRGVVGQSTFDKLRGLITATP